MCWSHSTCRWKDMCWVCILYTLACTVEFVLRWVSVYLTSSSSVLKRIQCDMKSKQWSNSSLLTLCSSVAFTPCATRGTWGMNRLRANSKVTSHWRSILHFPWCMGSDMFTYEKTMRSRSLGRWFSIFLTSLLTITIFEGPMMFPVVRDLESEWLYCHFNHTKCAHIESKKTFFPNHSAYKRAPDHKTGQNNTV